MNRRKSREAAMKLVYEMSITKYGIEETLETFKEESDLLDLDLAYIFRSVKGVESNLEFLDEKITQNLINWKLDRLSKINLAILRLCIYEIYFEEDIPDAVALNEAIDLAKIYSEDKSPAFINGVLDKILKQK